MEKTDAIIVLGHRLLPGNLPSEDLKRRIPACRLLAEDAPRLPGVIALLLPGLLSLFF